MDTATVRVQLRDQIRYEGRTRKRHEVLEVSPQVAAHLVEYGKARIVEGNITTRNGHAQ